MNESILKRNKILIVDRSPESIRSLVAALPSHYSKVVATSGRKALELLETATELPNLILLDTELPQMSGYDVCINLKQIPSYQDIPVILISSKNEIEEKIDGLHCGAVDFITKPFDPGEILSRVRVHLNIYNLKQELERRRDDLEDMVEIKAREISDMQQATIFSLVRLAEHRDDKIGGHLERTQKICITLAEKLAETPEYESVIDRLFIDNLAKAAPLHDIGKIGIPDDIHLKPGRLTPEEFQIMKRHAIIGTQALQRVLDKYPDNELIRMGVEIARCHHERWDGQGYPDGLAGTAIPLSARIVAIVDVFDALRMERPYKKPMPHLDSIVIMRRGRGTHFDPDLIDAFLAIEDEIERIYPAAGWVRN